MRVLLLGVEDKGLLDLFSRTGCAVRLWSDRLDPAFFADNPTDFVVSHRYRYLLKKDVLDLFPERVVNLHISLLPYNRGADPNLWSFLENTPKGVTVHHIDEGLDTGDIVAQRQIAFDDTDLTLRQTYARLSRAVIDLFADCWPDLIAGRAPRFRQPPGGTFHKLADKTPYLPLLARSWDTPVGMIAGLALKPKETP